MKSILKGLLAVALLCSAAAQGKTETFDLITFTPPPGKRDAGAEAIRFTDATSTTFCVMSVYKSAPSRGDPARDFRDEWDLLVARQFEVTSNVESETADVPGGWKMTMGAAKVHSEGSRDFIALLTTYSGFGSKVSVLANYNDDLYRPSIDKFLASIRLKAPARRAASGSRPPVSGGAAGMTSIGGAAPGFTFSVPEGFSETSGWYIGSQVEDRGGGREITRALVRPLPAVPAQGNMGDALHALWKGQVPAQLQESAGAMVYRRYVGDGVPVQFISGKGRENGRDADTLFTVYLIDCGEAWQPLVVAQTYDEPDTTVKSMIAFSASFSYGASAQLVEPFLAGVRCPGGKGRPLADRDALVGDYAFGSSSSLQWVNVYTGATSMTAVSYGGSLKLKPDGTYDYKFVGASGMVGAMNIQTDDGHGRWAAQGDLLILTRDDGKQTRYRIAGLTRFPSGEKAAVFMSRLDLPVNPTTLTNGGDYYAAKGN